jgi:iron complex outermembrane receptor protein
MAAMRFPRIRFLLVAFLVGLPSSVPAMALQEEPEVRGIVHDREANALDGVRITVEQTGQTAATGPDGRFSLVLSRPLPSVTLRFEHPQRETVVREIRTDALPVELDVVLSAQLRLEESVTVTASRLDIPARDNPAATTVVTGPPLALVPRGIAADETLVSVPGVKVDNQADGERVHLSIRGQGILAEHGIRGIQVLLDGIPLNDPTGFAPDLYDVDWTDVDRIDVLRGPVAFLYGGGSSGGVVSVSTRGGRVERLGGDAFLNAGSNGFYKAQGAVAGGSERLSGSLDLARTAGDGYREHTAFWGDNLYARAGWRPGPRVRLDAVFAATGYFNQNAEGLNLEWLAEDRRMANPDALTYNEYQKTVRQTGGLSGRFDLGPGHEIDLVSYFRHTRYTESVPSTVQHRSMDAPGLSVQYKGRFGRGSVRATLSAGTDLDGQTIDEHRRPNLGRAVEGEEKVSDQVADQGRVGLFGMARVEVGPRFAVLLGLRHDRIRNQLDDRLKAGGTDLSGERTFGQTTGRVGVSYAVTSHLDLYASWGQGFLPPATEELYANPDALGGFNTHLVSASSHGAEVGARGSLGRPLVYEVTVFHLTTTDDFERYRITERPLETFYRNGGDSRRWGLETRVDWLPSRDVRVTAAYTLSDFVYTRYDSISLPGDWSGNALPNSPRHQLAVEAEYTARDRWVLSGTVQALSRAYVDATNATWIDGYALLGLRLARRFRFGDRSLEAFVSARNLANVEYIAFTEPDPDGNSYQPGPEREVFGGLRVRF